MQILNLWQKLGNDFIPTHTLKDTWNKLMQSLKYHIGRYTEQNELVGSNEKWLITSRQWKKHKCFVCWQSFNTSTLGTDFRCYSCLDVNFKVHTKCLILFE